MKTIKFDNFVYDLVYDPVKQNPLVRITIVNTNLDIVDVATKVRNHDSIEVLDESGELFQSYEGYTDLVTIQRFDDYPIGEDTGSVFSIELAKV